MSKFEYKVEKFIRSNVGSRKLEKLINKLSEEKWELFSFTSSFLNGTTVIFRRLK